MTIGNTHITKITILVHYVLTYLGTESSTIVFCYTASKSVYLELCFPINIQLIK